MFDFGTRNIIQMNYTRYISLPKAWIDALCIKPGDRISIEMDERQRLVLSQLKAHKSSEEAGDDCTGHR